MDGWGTGNFQLAHHQRCLGQGGIRQEVESWHNSVFAPLPPLPPIFRIQFRTTKIEPLTLRVGGFLFSKISETPIVHVPKLFPLLHWFQNTFCFLSSSTPSHVGKFFWLQWENGRVFVLKSGLRTHFVFSVAQLLPMVIVFFGFNGNFNGKMTKKNKWPKITFRGPKWFPKYLNRGFRGVFVLKSGLRILIRAPEVPFSVPPKTPKMGVFG